MAEWAVCAQCRQPTSLGCSRRNVLWLGSRVWISHKRECNLSAHGREDYVNAGMERPAWARGDPVLLPLPVDEYFGLFLSGVCARCEWQNLARGVPWRHPVLHRSGKHTAPTASPKPDEDSVSRVQERHAKTVERLRANDPTLSASEKVAYYCDMLAACDSTSVAHANKSLVTKMVLNRKYSVFHREARKRLQPHELEQLTIELAHRGIGANFKHLREQKRG